MTTFPFWRRVTLPSVGSMPIQRILVRSSAGPYSVVCGAGALGHSAKEIAKLGSFSSVHIVSSARVWRAVGTRVKRGLGVKDAGAVHLMNDAEASKTLSKVQRRDGAALEYLITRNVAIKAKIVSSDERESGLREILNFGHTFAHALESITHYKRYQHGEAVAWGMMAAALLGREIAVTRNEDVCRIVTLVRRMGPLPPWPRVPAGNLIAAMRSDKKAREGKLRFVLTPRIGKAASYDGVPLPAVDSVV